MKDKAQRTILYYLAMQIPHVLIVLLLIGTVFIHIELAEWAKYIISALLLFSVVALVWGIEGMNGEVRLKKSQQQKQLDQTRLEPIYGESAKPDKVKEQ